MVHDVVFNATFPTVLALFNVKFSTLPTYSFAATWSHIFAMKRKDLQKWKLSSADDSASHQVRVVQMFGLTTRQNTQALPMLCKILAFGLVAVVIKFMLGVSPSSIMAASHSASQSIKLNSGRTIPAMGLGVYLIHGRACIESVSNALRIGYRHVDTAAYYENEAECGR